MSVIANCIQDWLYEIISHTTVDTVGIRAVTVAHILPIISTIYLLNCTLVGIKSVIVIDYWDGDRLPTIASNEEA